MRRLGLIALTVAVSVGFGGISMASSSREGATSASSVAATAYNIASIESATRAFNEKFGARTDVSFSGDSRFATGLAVAVYPEMPEGDRRLFAPPIPLKYGVFFRYSSPYGVSDAEIQRQIAILNESSEFGVPIMGAPDDKALHIPHDLSLSGEAPTYWTNET